jgi:uncharacterized protein (TIGR01777 family)
MKVVVAGATGFIGRPLVQSLVDDGAEVVALTRDTSAAAARLPSRASAALWDGRTVDAAWASEVRGADAVINLAGANIGAKRWTAERKREILESRTESTGAIVDVIAQAPAGERPKVLVNASGVDYYGDRGDEIVTEESRPGQSFLADVCIQWEAAAQGAERLGVRVVRMRTSPVFGRGAEVLAKLAMPFKLFAGGPIGSGRQWFSWIHLADAVGLYRFAVDRPDAAGALNLVAPDARREADLAREIGRVLGRPSWAPAPAIALKLALGERSDLVLHGRHAEPKKALPLGYTFKYPTLPEALRDALPS